MKSLLEMINEAKTKQSFYAIKFVAGKYKDSYLGSDGVGYTVTTDFEHGNNGSVMKYFGINNAKTALEHFNEWSKGSWGDTVIVEITITETTVK